MMDRNISSSSRNDHQFVCVMIQFYFQNTKHLVLRYQLDRVKARDGTPATVAEILDDLLSWETEYLHEQKHQLTLYKMAICACKALVERLKYNVSTIYTLMSLSMFTLHAQRYHDWWASMERRFFYVTRNIDLLLPQ